VVGSLVIVLMPMFRSGPTDALSLPEPPLRAVRRGSSGSIWCVAYSPNGEILVSRGTGDGVRIWGRAADRPCGAFLLQQSWTTALWFAPRAGALETGLLSPEGRVWDVTTGEIRHSVPADPSARASARFRRATGVGGSTARLRNLTLLIRDLTSP
jgi:hypothetical protein